MKQTELGTRRLQVKCYAALAAIPFLIGFIDPWVGMMLRFMLAIIIIPAIYLIALAVTLRWSVRGWRGADGDRSHAWRWLAALFPPVMLAVALCLAPPMLFAGGHVGTWTRLAAKHDAYQHIVRLAQAGRLPDSGEIGGTRYQIDAGPPIRIAFDGEGLLNNWSGIVHDPTGAVMQADGFDPVTGTFHAPDRITGLFGGDLVACRPLWWDYYACSFT